jgi:hypothetical protein
MPSKFLPIVLAVSLRPVSALWLLLLFAATAVSRHGHGARFDRYAFTDEAVHLLLACASNAGMRQSQVAVTISMNSMGHVWSDRQAVAGWLKFWRSE